MELPDISAKLIGLKKADLKLREKLVKSGKLFQGYNEEMRSLHKINGDILMEIISEIGYPTIEKVGEEANEATWLVIQHAIDQPQLILLCEKLLKTAVEEGQAEPIHLAFLTDRIAVLQNKPQLFGTQFDWGPNGELHPNHYDDLILVNERRKAIGLNTLEEQTDIIRKRAAQENQIPPDNIEARKNEMEKWKREVGWI
ncbi:hypothetical protein KIH41_16470 [Litoribacter ruber]|uniref:DUF6624 domain-containing protein n=1 Tax=Litoribacter ruber TaxID=702568 RepID=UPI001BDA4299|nr:DUF6624 domain-containing protein [Litoribacter ruber]MBT0812883.1 hypothetical protein [Litoribacter ruber]